MFCENFKRQRRFGLLLKTKIGTEILKYRNRDTHFSKFTVDMVNYNYSVKCIDATCEVSRGSRRGVIRRLILDEWYFEIRNSFICKTGDFFEDLSVRGVDSSVDRAKVRYRADLLGPENTEVQLR